MTRYIRRPLTSEDRNVHRILSEEPIQRLIAEGCFVAGGSMLMATWGSWKLGESLFLDDYLKSNDIDVFATSEESHRRAMVVVGDTSISSPARRMRCANIRSPGLRFSHSAMLRPISGLFAPMRNARNS